MEWNHFLPRNIFGDQPIGHYLLLKQHAIASALQTLVFKKNCMFGWHKRYLPENLLKLTWPYYCKLAADNGRKTAEMGVGVHAPGVASEAGKRGGVEAAKTNRKNGTGIYDPEIRELSYISSRKPVELTCLTSGDVLIFKSRKEAASTLNLDPRNLLSVCQGKRKQTGGYTAKFISP
jgi:hypothetical protein